MSDGMSGFEPRGCEFGFEQTHKWCPGVGLTGPWCVQGLLAVAEGFLLLLLFHNERRQFDASCGLLK